MTAVLALAGMVAVIAALVWLEKRSGGEVSWREPIVANDSWVRVGRSLSVGEAEVALGLLESHGIAVKREARGPELPPRYRAGAETRYDLSVAPEDEATARELLGEPEGGR